MRPAVLFPLFAAVETLPGIGPKNAKLVAKLAGPHVVDLLWHLPTGLVDRRARPTIADAEIGGIATLLVRVEGHVPAPTSHRAPHRVRCRDDSGSIDLVYFHASADWLAKILPVGAERAVSGRVDVFQGLRQMVHPDYVEPPAKLAELAVTEAVYPLTGGLAPRILQRAIGVAVDRTPELPEWLDPALQAQRGWPAWRSAIIAAHRPDSPPEAASEMPARVRLAYDELLANQLALTLVRASMRRLPGRSLAGNGALQARVETALPFRLTGSQRTALAEIAGDMAADVRMLRLLQGDVGSGKTVVALLAMLTAVEAGCQAALLAPTEILARQHLATIEPLVETAGLRLALLTGRDKGRRRNNVLQALEAGEIAIIVGTHALLSEDVAFRDLGLAVVDEQHRFGVHQRLSLSQKGRGVDILVMTATPIPRTLQLTAYGDMEVSRLTDKPPGRQPIDTRVLPLDRLEDVAAGVARRLAEGAKVFWVCPLVEDSEAVDLAAASDRYEQLRQRFGDTVGLVHGRLGGAEKDAVMAAFSEGSVNLLVATTVIEVGVNVPAATVMVIEHAERFGLAQLHQLRGRIGRGWAAGTCLLLYAPPLGEAAHARLATLRATDDGFKIAEEDLRLRGPGEMLGLRQSGLPAFRLADLAIHGDLLPVASDDARLVLARDPDLKGPRGEALRTLLYLFERDAAVKYLRSG